jgi:hypothetical protein
MQTFTGVTDMTTEISYPETIRFDAETYLFAYIDEESYAELEAGDIDADNLSIVYTHLVEGADKPLHVTLSYARYCADMRKRGDRIHQTRGHDVASGYFYDEAGNKVFWGANEWKGGAARVIYQYESDMNRR